MYLTCHMCEIVTEWEKYHYFCYWRRGNQGEEVFLAPCPLKNKALRLRLCVTNTVLLNHLNYRFYEMICEETCVILYSVLLSLSLQCIICLDCFCFVVLLGIFLVDSDSSIWSQFKPHRYTS